MSNFAFSLGITNVSVHLENNQVFHWATDAFGSDSSEQRCSCDSCRPVNFFAKQPYLISALSGWPCLGVVLFNFCQCCVIFSVTQTNEFFLHFGLCCLTSASAFAVFFVPETTQHFRSAVNESTSTFELPAERFPPVKLVVMRQEAAHGDTVAWLLAQSYAEWHREEDRDGLVFW